MFRPTRFRFMRIFLLAVLLVLPGIAQQKPANAKAEPVGPQVADKTPDSAARLPVKRVVLYKDRKSVV